MSLTEISTDVFQRNRKAEQITAALEALDKARLAYRREFRDTGGAPAQRWNAGQRTDEINEAT